MRRTSSLRLVSLVLALFMVTLAGCTAKESKPADKPAAPAYPSKPVTFIAPSGAGGGWDTFARAITKVMADEKLVTQALPVENRAGGSGATALSWLQASKKGSDDVLIVYSPPLIINGVTGASPFTYRDLTPIARVIADYNVILVKKDAPWKNLPELVAAIKADPSKISVGGGSVPGGMDHVAVALVLKKAGVDISKVKYVPFQGGGEAMTSLLGGHVQAVSSGLGEASAQIEAGNVRALAITSDKRLSGKAADIPTAREQGVDVTYQVWRGVFGPPGMPENAKKFWQDALAKMVKTPGWNTVLTNYNWTDTFDNSGFDAFLANQEQTYRSVLDELGLGKK